MRPRVSGQNFLTKKNETTLTSANSPNVSVAPSASTSSGNTNEMIALRIHRTNTAMPIAKPRIVIGKISESSSQTSVPMKPCTKTTTISIAARIR